MTLLEELIKLTPAKDITEAGLFDRENLDLPFSSKNKLVALLGDSAHPQTPLLGQGVNMAIADAYVYATNIAIAKKKKTNSLRDAISDSDTVDRHKEAKSLVGLARTWCTLMTSQNFLICWMMSLSCRFLPASEIVNTMEKSDKSNSDFLKFLDKHCSPEQQEAMKA